MLVYIHNNMITFKRTNDIVKEESHLKFSTVAFLNEFKINIVLAETNFHISINNKFCNTVKYDLPNNILNTIQIMGQLEYIKQVDHRKYFPYTWPPIQITEDRVHFSNEQPMPFKPGHVMVIKAQLFGNDRGRFIMHFRNARDNERQELHISVRFDKRQIARNSKIVPLKVKRTDIEYYE